MSGLHMERTWTAEEIVEDLRSALAIVEHLQPPDDLRVPVFNVAVQLTSQRAMRQQIGAVHLPAAGPLG